MPRGGRPGSKQKVDLLLHDNARQQTDVWTNPVEEHTCSNLGGGQKSRVWIVLGLTALFMLSFLISSYPPLLLLTHRPARIEEAPLQQITLRRHRTKTKTFSSHGLSTTIFCVDVSITIVGRPYPNLIARQGPAVRIKTQLCS